MYRVGRYRYRQALCINRIVSDYNAFEDRCSEGCLRKRGYPDGIPYHEQIYQAKIIDMKELLDREDNKQDVLVL